MCFGHKTTYMSEFKKSESGSSCDVFIVRTRERKTERQTGNRGIHAEKGGNQQGVTNIFILWWERQTESSERERKA